MYALDRREVAKRAYSLAIKYTVNAKTHLRMNVFRLLKRLIYSSRNWEGVVPGSSKWEQTGLLYSICGWNASKRSPNPEPARQVDDPICRRLAHVARTHRQVLGLNQNESMSDQWMKRNALRLVPYMVYLLRCCERQGVGKMYDVLPVCRIRMHYITIDTSVLHGIARELKITGSILVKMNNGTPTITQSI